MVKLHLNDGEVHQVPPRHSILSSNGGVKEFEGERTINISVAHIEGQNDPVIILSESVDPLMSRAERSEDEVSSPLLINAYFTPTIVPATEERRNLKASVPSI